MYKTILDKRTVRMGTPWGMITARKEAKKHGDKLEELKERIDKAIELLKMEKPDIELVIRILEEE